MAIARERDRGAPRAAAEVEDRSAAALGQLSIEGDVGAAPAVLVIVERGVGVVLPRSGVDQIVDQLLGQPPGGRLLLHSSECRRRPPRRRRRRLRGRFGSSSSSAAADELPLPPLATGCGSSAVLPAARSSNVYSSTASSIRSRPPASSAWTPFFFAEASRRCAIKRYFRRSLSRRVTWSCEISGCDSSLTAATRAPPRGSTSLWK